MIDYCLANTFGFNRISNIFWGIIVALNIVFCSLIHFCKLMSILVLLLTSQHLEVLKIFMSRNSQSGLRSHFIAILFASSCYRHII
ncbi:hypothetical protein WN943_000882 [Citrus x changshan-huyou]